MHSVLTPVAKIIIVNFPYSVKLLFNLEFSTLFAIIFKEFFSVKCAVSAECGTAAGGNLI